MEDKQICNLLKGYGTSTVSDAMDKLGYNGGLLGIHPVSIAKTICGRAFTVKYIPCGTEKNSVGDFIDDVDEGQVVVIANDGRLDCTVWGDIMSLYAHIHNIAGTVIDGVCRDLDKVHESGYPIYAKGVYLVTGKDRVQCDAVNVPVSVCGKMVKAGDYILGDASGVISIPEEIIDKVLEAAKSISDTEELIRAEVTAGGKLKDARAKHGYHKLQTKDA